MVKIKNTCLANVFELSTRWTNLSLLISGTGTRLPPKNAKWLATNLKESLITQKNNKTNLTLFSLKLLRLIKVQRLEQSLKQPTNHSYKRVRTKACFTKNRKRLPVASFRHASL